MTNSTTNKIGLVNLPDLPDSADNILKNLTDPPSKNIGRTFGDIWYLVFGGISQKADKKRMKYNIDLEKYHQELTQSISQIPENKQTEPSIQVTAQALENSKYCVSSEQLRKMFVNLISGSMNIDTKNFAHPAFPEIIKQLSSEDALLLQEIALNNQMPIVRIELRFNDGGYRILYHDVFLSKTLDFSPNVVTLSLFSLQRANLISIDYSEYSSDSSLYEAFYKTPEFAKAEELCRTSDCKEAYLRKGLVNLTPIGKIFCFICIKQN